MSKAVSANQNILRVDVSTGRTTVEEIDDQTQRAYLGGTILGAKYLYQEVKPGATWDSPNNILWVGTGPLTGAGLGGAGSVSLVTKGPMTDGATSTQANGFLGAYLKFSGFDHILIQGASKEWKYLYIHDGVAELRDASHLLGKDTTEMEEALKKELGYQGRGLSVFSIGPAGENKVRWATLTGDGGHVASKNGVGAVLGAKRLKAIAVARGAGKLTVADPQRMKEVSEAVWERCKKGNVYEWGTSQNFANAIVGGWLPVKNYTTNLFPEWTRFMGEKYRKEWDVDRHPCWACQTKHCNIITLPEGGDYAGHKGDEPEYECWSGLGPAIGNTNPRAAFVLSDDIDRLGLDVNEAGWVIGWTMECYEKELLTRDQLDGLEMNWGNVEAARQLVRNIANRKGFGDVLAEGVKRASERIGGEAAKCAVYTLKGNTPRGHDHRGRWPEMFDTCVSVTSTVETFTTGVPNAENYGLPARQDPFNNPLQIAEVEAATKGSAQFEDSMVTCRFVTGCNLPLLVQALEAATGWKDFTFQEALTAGRRAINLMRVFNIRHGMDPKLDRPSFRYGSVPTDGPAKGLSPIPHWDEMLRIYYDKMGWDEGGVPKIETLTALGLEVAAKDVAALKR
ncbi:MAG: aldehyde ferredoxin oxidoreductase C-terminal domain-containing protein [Chloroflexota bacterium]|nr:aldehyde ferredoxin oxidoreductase C-terminal domain-containing protein [Chloroflexota bacterium]